MLQLLKVSSLLLLLFYLTATYSIVLPGLGYSFFSSTSLFSSVLRCTAIISYVLLCLFPHSAAATFSLFLSFIVVLVL